jgi:hypothetical protein
VTSVTNPVTVGTNNDKTGYTLSASGVAAIEAALINEGDGQQLINAIVGVINSSLDVPALELAAIANAVRSELATELARLDVAISTRLATAGYTAPPTASANATAVWANGTRTITGGTVTTVSDKTGYRLTQAFPANFAALGINASGHVSRVTLVDTTTSSSGLDAASIRSAIGLASANLDTQLGDIPTVAEFNARSLPSADYFVVGDYTVPPTAAANASQVRT